MELQVLKKKLRISSTPAVNLELKDFIARDTSGRDNWKSLERIGQGEMSRLLLSISVGE